MEPIVHLVLRLLLTAILVLSLVAKLRDYRRFRVIVARYEVVPVEWTGTASALAVVWEAAAVAALWAWPSVGPLFAGMLFGIYGLATVVNLIRGRTHIDCGCEWGGREPMATAAKVTPWLPIRNLGLVLLALTLCAPRSDRPLGMLDYGLIGASAAFFVAVFLAMDRAVRQWLALRLAFPRSGIPADV